MEQAFQALDHYAAQQAPAPQDVLTSTVQKIIADGDNEGLRAWLFRANGYLSDDTRPPTQRQKLQEVIALGRDHLSNVYYQETVAERQRLFDAHRDLIQQIGLGTFTVSADRQDAIEDLVQGDLVGMESGDCCRLTPHGWNHVTQYEKALPKDRRVIFKGMDL